MSYFFATVVSRSVGAGRALPAVVLVVVVFCLGFLLSPLSDQLTILAASCPTVRKFGHVRKLSGDGLGQSIGLGAIHGHNDHEGAAY